MRVLVTGGTGYLGRALVRALVDRGHTPVVFARSASASELPGIPIDGDVRDAAGVERAARGCDAICHAAALVSIWRPDPREFDEVNVGGLQNVLTAARSCRIPRIVYTSSFLALPPSDGTTEMRANDYQRTKVDARRLARSAGEAGAPLICVYPGVIYGPGVRTEGNLTGRMIADHLAGKLPGIIGSDRRWSYSFVDDVAAGHVAALERGSIGAEYRLCGENAPQMRVFEIVRDLTGRPLPRRIPFAAAGLIGFVEETKARLLARPPLLTRGVVEIFRREWAYDSSLAAGELGYRITPLREGLRRTVDRLGAAS
jgi:farnesol dehydrogenase